MADGATPPNEPIVEDAGFTPEEQAQFDSMRQDSPIPGEGGAPEAPAVDPAQPSPAVDPAVAAAPAAPQDGADDDDDDDPEPAATQPAAADGKTPQQRRVAYGKYQRLKARAEKTAADLATEKAERTKDRETQARLDERLRLLNEALTAPPPAAEKTDEDPEPDAEKDIFGWVAWKKRDDIRLRQEVSDLRQGRQAESADTELFNNYRQEAEVYAQREPNFVPAYQHLMRSRTIELAQYYYGKDLEDPATPPLTAQEITRIKTTVANEEKQLVAEAFKTGTSPAARVMAMARGRGFRPQAPGAANGAPPANGAAATAPAVNGAPQAAPAAAAPGALANGSGAAPAAPSVKDEIANIKNGQAAALSLSSGGGVPTSPLTPERLANMNEEDFGHLMDSLSETKIKELMGGA